MSRLFSDKPIPYCAGRKWRDWQCLCMTDKPCEYRGEAPSYKCPQYYEYEKLQMLCESFFDWRRRVNRVLEF
jgi:hypothetical protein